MPDYQTPNTYGLPQNPLTSAMAQDAHKGRGIGRHKSSEQNLFLSKMESPGITSTSGAALGSSNPVGAKVTEEPQQIATPDVVSAMDPAYSMHPLLRALAPALAQQGSQMGIPHSWGSPWQMLGPEFRGKNATQSQLLSALGMPGLDWGIKTQGEAL